MFSFVVNVCGSPRVTRHQFTMCRTDVEKHVSTSPEAELHFKRHSMTEAGRNNQVVVKLGVSMKGFIVL